MSHVTWRRTALSAPASAAIVAAAARGGGNEGGDVSTMGGGPVLNNISAMLDRSTAPAEALAAVAEDVRFLDE
jgi:hypothetical protein